MHAGLLAVSPRLVDREHVAVAVFATLTHRDPEAPSSTFTHVGVGGAERQLIRWWDRSVRPRAPGAYAWFQVALRSFAQYLADRGIHREGGQSTLRLVRMPKVKDEWRRALTDDEMIPRRRSSRIAEAKR